MRPALPSVGCDSKKSCDVSANEKMPGGAWSGRLQLELRATFALPALTAAKPTATLGLATRAPLAATPPIYTPP